VKEKVKQGEGGILGSGEQLNIVFCAQLLFGLCTPMNMSSFQSSTADDDIPQRTAHRLSAPVRLLRLDMAEMVQPRILMGTWHTSMDSLAIFRTRHPISIACHVPGFL
jgi:hypothetical protein